MIDKTNSQLTSEEEEKAFGEAMDRIIIAMEYVPPSSLYHALQAPIRDFRWRGHVAIDGKTIFKTDFYGAPSRLMSTATNEMELRAELMSGLDYKNSQPIRPPENMVVSALCANASSVLYAFEEWAEAVEESADSTKARQRYWKSIREGILLRRHLGEAAFNILLKGYGVLPVF